MTTQTEKFNALHVKTMPDVKPGYTVKVHQKIKEGDKERIQIFEGVVIARKHGQGISATITVRKVVDGVGVERIFPVHSPSISKIDVVKLGKVRRSKLYYLRTAKGKKAKLKKKDLAAAVAEPIAQVEPEPEVAEIPTETAPTATEPEIPTTENP